MENFASVVSILALCSISGTNGGAIPLSEERGRSPTEMLPARRYDVQESRRRSISPRNWDLGTDFPRNGEPPSRREELLEQLRIELNEYHEMKQRRNYLGPNGAPQVGGKSLLGSLSTIVDLFTKILPWFGINPPKPMSSGGQMMMRGGGGQMMQGSGGNYMLVPIYPYYPYPYLH